MIGIVDLGTGNLFSVIKACRRCSIDFSIVTNPKEVFNYKILILPGVGAYPAAMAHLSSNGMVEALKSFQDNGKYLIGICLGMQLLMDSSEEFSFSRGLGFISGDVKMLQPTLANKIPNIGWCETFHDNSADILRLKSLVNKHDFYYAHSYYCDLEKESEILAYTYFGNQKIPALISNGCNVFGMQFHPEISGDSGIGLFSNLIHRILQVN